MLVRPRLLLCFLGILEVVGAFLLSPSRIGPYDVSHTARTRSGVTIEPTPSPASSGWSKTVARFRKPPSRQRGWQPLYAEEDQKKKTGIDEKVRTKLLSESIAPWRSLRLFLYGSLGTGALIGGLITLSGTAAIVSGAKEGDMNTELTNLAIDFGAVLAFALLAKYDIDKQKELDERVEERVAEKKEQRKLAKGMKERELALQNLMLNVRVSAKGDIQQALVKELQAGAKQHMIIVVGPRKACRDALVGANLLKMDFAMSNILVVPYDTGADKQSRPEGGFAQRPMYETQAYVAEPAGEGWEDYIQAEMDAAVEQNGEQARDEGIAIVVSSAGRIIRRGVGKVPWRQMVEQLDQSLKEGAKANLFI